MSNHVVLNNVAHKDLRIITRRSAEYGDDVMYSLTFASEFRSIQAHYPIVFRKDSDTGEFHAVALFGFERGENLFLTQDGWDATYIPMTIARQPFLIGYQHQREQGEVTRKTVIHIDMDNPRVSDSEGERVFLELGGYTEFLNRVNTMLATIHEGMEHNKAFIESLLANELIESFTLDVELDDGSKYWLAGFYTINEEKLAQLQGDVLASLSRQGFLMPIFMAIASMSNLRALIDRRNARLDPKPDNTETLEAAPP